MNDPKKFGNKFTNWCDEYRGLLNIPMIVGFCIVAPLGDQVVERAKASFRRR